MRSRIILNADDFGLTPGINQAVLALHRAGVLSSATLMASGGAFQQAAELARITPTLGVGCHLIFVDGLPVSDPRSIPTLIGPDGRSFRSTLKDFVSALFTGRINSADLERESQAQIQKLQQAGVTVSHVDTHKHTHIFPAVSRAVFRTAQRCNVQAIRFPFEPGWSVDNANAPLGRRMQLHLLNGFAAPVRSILRDAGRQGFLPDGTLGIAATGTLDADVLRRTLSALPPGSTYEFCCHPGHQDSALAAQTTRLRSSREVEYQALLHVLPDILRTEGGPELIHYGNLGNPGHARYPDTPIEKVI